MFLANKPNPNKEVKKAEVQNPKILEVNLIKDEIGVSFDWGRGLVILGLVLLLASLLVIEIYSGLNWWEKRENVRIAAAQAEVDKIKSETVQLQNKATAALFYKEKSASFSQLITEHVYWSNFFRWLETNTLSTVHFEGFKGDLTGKYTLAARARTYADVSWQANAFLKDPLIKSVEITQASVDRGKDQTSEVKFELVLEIDPTIFKSKK